MKKTTYYVYGSHPEEYFETLENILHRIVRKFTTTTTVSTQKNLYVFIYMENVQENRKEFLYPTHILNILTLDTTQPHRRKSEEKSELFLCCIAHTEVHTMAFPGEGRFQPYIRIDVN